MALPSCAVARIMNGPIALGRMWRGDAEVTDSQGAGRLYVWHLSNRQDARPNDARGARNYGDRDGDDCIGDRRAQRCRHDQRQDQQGEALHDVHDALGHQIGHPAQEPVKEAHHSAQDRSDSVEAIPTAKEILSRDDPAVDVPPQVVGPQPVGG